MQPQENPGEEASMGSAPRDSPCSSGGGDLSGGMEEDFVEMDDDQLHTIRTGLYLGSMRAEANLEALRSKGITHILQVGEGLRPSHGEEFIYKHIQVDDDEREDLVAHFPKCFDFIEEARAAEGRGFYEKGAVLVHCAAGASRSATVCLGYLMWQESISFDDSWRVVHAARPWICPNDGFKKQLFEFERLGADNSKWRAWRHVEEERRRELKRTVTPSKIVSNRGQFCSLEV